MISNREQSKWDIAVLLHLSDWPGGDLPYKIIDNVSLCNFSGSKIESLYQRLCVNYLIDDEEPFTFRTYLHFKSIKYSDMPPIPHSLIDRIINLFVIATREPYDYYRMISSYDNFESHSNTSDLYHQSEYFDFLNLQSVPLDQEVVRDISKMANNLGISDSPGRELGRIPTVLVYYYYAWCSQYLDQVAINLAITLEYLFAPEGRTELAHQISVNSSRFIQHIDPDLEKNYRTVKKLYSLRSSLIHGNEVSHEKMVNVIEPAYLLVSSILKELLKSKSLIDTFGNEHRRRALIKSYVFGN